MKQSMRQTIVWALFFVICGISTNIFAYSDTERSEIISSINRGEIESAFRIIDQHPLEEINYPFEKNGGTLLHLVVRAYRLKGKHYTVDIIRRLIDRGIAVNRLDHKGKPAIFYLRGNKNAKKIVELLTQSGADLSLRDHSGRTVLHIYTEKRNLELVRQFIELGAEVNVKDNMDVSPLMIAVKTGQENIAEYLLGVGADINAVDKSGNGPIHVAAITDNIYMLDYLSKKGVSLEQRNHLGETALSILASAKKWASVKLLIERGVNTNVPLGGSRTPKEPVGLYLLLNSELGMAHLITKENFNVHQKTGSAYGEPEAGLVGRAVSERKLDVLKKLIALGADVNERGSSPISPLMSTVYQNPDNIGSILPIIKTLLENGADVKEIDQQGSRDSVLMTAAVHGYTPTVQLLLEYGADATVVYGSRVQFQCMQKRKYEIMLMLLKAGMPIDFKDSRFWMLLKELANKVEDDEKLGNDTIRPELFMLFFERRPVVDLSNRYTGEKIKSIIDEMSKIDSLTVTSGLSKIVYTNKNKVVTGTAPDKVMNPNQKKIPDPVINLPKQTYSVDAKLYVIGVYEGYKEDDTPWWAKCRSETEEDMLRCHQQYASTHQEGVVTVSLAPSSSPVILALMAYEPVKWVIRNENGVIVEGIILSGYHGQRVTGITENIPVDVYSYKHSNCGTCQVGEGYFYAYKPGTKEFKNAYSKLKELTNIEPSSFQGKYKAQQFTIFER